MVNAFLETFWPLRDLAAAVMATMRALASEELW